MKRLFALLCCTAVLVACGGNEKKKAEEATQEVIATEMLSNEISGDLSALDEIPATITIEYQDGKYGSGIAAKRSGAHSYSIAIPTIPGSEDRVVAVLEYDDMPPIEKTVKEVQENEDSEEAGAFGTGRVF